MPDYNELLNLIKQASNEANEASKPVNVCFGKVLSTSPLQIVVDQKMTLGSAQLVLSRNVTDFKTKITAGNTKNYYYTGSDTDGGTAPVTPNPHVHAIGKIQVTVHNALEQGDEVILLRMQEGQKYIVLDRIGG